MADLLAALAASLERCRCGHLRVADHTDWWDDGEQGGMGCTRRTCGDPDLGPHPTAKGRRG